MSAKKKTASAKPAASPAPATPDSAGTVTAVAPEPAWIDHADPKRRTWGRIVLVALWLYVLALWLLALDQTFDWGIFGPKVPATL